jgi:glyoxylase-like metal-dependent hydrolase (beta-lactamase superfamily II)/rhodanese-related sulfurtransferase
MLCGNTHVVKFSNERLTRAESSVNIRGMEASSTPIAFVDEGLGNSSYLVDLGDGRGLVIDPERHPAGYLAAAGRRRVKVAYAAETHLHADFVSGGRELHAHGATLIAPAAGAHAFPTRGMRHGDELGLGGLTLRALATPGHTPEHLAYLLLDGARPTALFSGGSLLVGSIARTDLTSPDQTESLARELWRSLREHILPLPDDLPVYPTHGAGSFCAAPAGTERTTTIGREKAGNPLLAAPDEDSFVGTLLAGFGSFPPYFLRLREVNRLGPQLHGPAEPTLPTLTVEEVRRLQQAGAYVVDARPVDAYGQEHIAGSVSIPLRPQFASWLGWIVPPDVPVVFVLDPEQDRTDLLLQARNIGYDKAVGELAGGMAAWTGARHPVDSIPIVDAAEVTVPVVDVRQRHEYTAGHLPGARNVELGSLPDVDLPAGPVAVMCGHGERSMTAASLLQRAGRRDVTVLTGGPDDWASAHGELETGA